VLVARFVVRLALLTVASIREGATPAQEVPIALVRCRRCGVFVPRVQSSGGPSDEPLCRSCRDA